MRVASDQHSAKAIAEVARVLVKIGHHLEQMDCYVTDTGRYCLILDVLWVELHSALSRTIFD